MKNSADDNLFWGLRVKIDNEQAHIQFHFHFQVCSNLNLEPRPLRYRVCHTVSFWTSLLPCTPLRQLDKSLSVYRPKTAGHYDVHSGMPSRL